MKEWKIIGEKRPDCKEIAVSSLAEALKCLCEPEIAASYADVFRRLQAEVGGKEEYLAYSHNNNGAVQGVIVSLGHGDVLVSMIKGQFAVKERGREPYSFHSSLSIPDLKEKPFNNTDFVIASGGAAIFLRVEEVQTTNGHKIKRVMIDGGKFP